MVQQRESASECQIQPQTDDPERRRIKSEPKNASGNETEGIACVSQAEIVVHVRASARVNVNVSASVRGVWISAKLQVRR